VSDSTSLPHVLTSTVVSLPVTLYNSPAVQGYAQPSFGIGGDIAGVILWAIGVSLEAVADIQKYRFRSNPANSGRACNVGAFAWSRHPNYFGEMMTQFGIYAMCAGPAATGWVPMGSGAHAALLASVIGAVLLTVLLMFVSGLTLQERPGAKKRYEKGGEQWEEFKAYTQQTSILIPFPPALYRLLPTFIKRTLFLEFPIYVFDPAKHADQNKVQQRLQEEGRTGSSEPLS
jgi:steroid 5-alpha reductase family enzyme